MIEDNLWTFLCPNCGSNDRVTQQVVDKDKADGILPDHVQFGLSHFTEVRVIDPKKKYKPGDKASVLMCYHDFCAKCGTNYCYRIMRIEIKFSMNLDNLIKIPPMISPGNISRNN